MRAESTANLPARTAAAAVYLCFFLSGAAGLIYEVLWSRYLALYVGSTGLAQLIVLCAFMGGIALGSQLFGRIADRCASPLAWYAGMEAVIGLYALGFDFIFAVGRDAFIGFVQAAGMSAGNLTLAKIGASALTILVPTVLMGGTLPMLGRHLVRSLGGIGPQISRLYFVNSIGAFAGCLAAGFWMIRAYGLSATMIAGGVLNLLVAAAALAISNRTSAPAAAPAAEKTPVGPGLSRNMALMVLAASALSGAVAMMYEVAWIRMLALVLGSSTYAFSLMLATFILGLALGGLILSFRKKTGGYGWIFALSSGGVGLAVLLSLPFYVRLPYVFNQLASTITREPGSFGVYQVCQFVLCALVMLLPTVLQGITLPAATKVVTGDLGSLGRRVGLVFAINTLGTMAGAVFAGFWGLPNLGVKGTLELAIALNMAIAVAMLWTARNHPKFKRVFAGSVAVVAAAWIAYGVSMGPWDREVFSAGLYRVASRVPSFEDFKRDADKRKMVFYRDGTDATVAVVDTAKERALVINGKADASTIGDLATQKLLGHLPMLVHPRPENVLVVGIGSGATVGSVLKYDVKLVDAIEISEDVIEASRLFDGINGRYWEDPRVRIHCEDAKTFLQLTGEKYDVIVSEPSNPWMAGIAGVFSKEFYQTCLTRLAPGGVFVQWLHAYDMDDATFFMMVETFRSSFPHWTLWNSEGSDVIFIGSARSYGPDFARMEARMQDPRVRTDLEGFGIGSLASILSLQMADFADMRSPEGWSGVVHSDFHPLLDYEAPRAFFLKAKAGALTWIDERGDSHPNARIWLAEYLKGKSAISPAELRQCYDYSVNRRGLFSRQPLCWAQEWYMRHPADVSAQFAYGQELGIEPGGVPVWLSRIQPAPGRQAYTKQLLLARSRYEDHAQTKNAMRVLNADAVLRDVLGWKKYPEADQALADAWLGQIQYDTMRYREAVAGLTAAAGQFRAQGRRDEMILAGVYLCKSLLALQSAADAAAAYREFLEPHAGDLRVRLMRIEIEAAGAGRMP